MNAARISLVFGLLVFGMLMLAGASTETSVFRGFIVIIGIGGLILLHRFFMSVIRPPEPVSDENREEDAG